MILKNIRNKLSLYILFNIIYSKLLKFINYLNNILFTLILY